MVHEKFLVSGTQDVPNTCFYCYNVVEVVSSQVVVVEIVWNPQLVLILLRYSHHRHGQERKQCSISRERECHRIFIHSLPMHMGVQQIWKQDLCSEVFPGACWLVVLFYFVNFLLYPFTIVRDRSFVYSEEIIVSPLCIPWVLHLWIQLWVEINWKKNGWLHLH